MTPEFDFLLTTVRRFFRLEFPVPVPSFEGLDWSEVLRLADRHAVTGFLRRACDTPELRSNARAAARFNLILSEALVTLLDLFEKNKIDVVSLKGPILGAALYGDEALKPSQDLDLLVRPSDALRAVRTLRDAGYRMVSVPHWHGEEAYLRNPDGELLFSDRTDQIGIDLHWRLLPLNYPALFDEAELWSNLRSVQWGRARARTLGPEHLLLFLCVHGGKHSWQRLGWICDVARLLQVEPDVDWPATFAQARRSDTLAFLSLSLLLASEVLGVELPSPAARLMVTDARTRALLATVMKRLPAGDNRSSAVDSARFAARVFDRRANWMRLVAGTVFFPTEAEYRALQLPPRLYWMYYLFRPLRLASKYGQQVLFSLRPGDERVNSESSYGR